MRVLVLGGTVFVGPHVVDELLRAGHEVSIFHRGEHEHPLVAAAHHVHGDFMELDRHLPALLALEPEVVIDMHAFRREEGQRILAFAEVATRGVVASSVDVYRAFGRLHRTEPGPPDPVPLTEDSPLREIVIQDDYDKIGVELEARSSSTFPVCILRLPAIHGPGDYLHRLYHHIKPMADGHPTIELDPSVARWRWVRGYVEDVAHAICLAIGADAAGRTYNVCDPISFSEEEWVRKIASVMDWSGEIALVEKEQPYDARQDFVVDSSRVRDELGYVEPTDPDEALRQTIEWELANPPAR